MIIRVVAFLLLACSALAQGSRRDWWAAMPYVAAAPGGSVTATYIDNYTTNNAGSSYTFAVSFGSESASRKILAAIGSRDTGTFNEITAVTIGGVGATLVARTNNITSAITFGSLWIADLPTGTSGNVEITFNNSTLRANLAIINVAGASSYTSASDNTAGTMSATVTAVANGAIVAHGATSSAVTSTWSGNVTEVYDVSATSSYSGALTNGAAAGSTLIECTVSGNSILNVVSFSP